MDGPVILEKTYSDNDTKTHTINPTCSGTSVIGIKFKDGVVIAADMLVSYGSLARYKNFERVVKVNDKAVMACSGDVADFQFLKDYVMEHAHTDDLLGDGFTLSCNGLHSWLTRVLYYRRSCIDPLWNNYVVGGVQSDDTPFLGYCSMLGISFTDDCVTTGFGAYLALPILRRCIKERANDDINNLEENDAIDAITDAMRQLYYRDCRAFDTYQLAIIRKDGAEVRGPIRLETDWSIAEYVEGYD